MDKKLRELQLVELELFKNLSKICEEYGIKYFALGGTLLGAIRHKGFIPWDDDIDIGIPREDYERLLKLCENELKDKIKIRTFKNDEKYFRYFAHIESSDIKIKRMDKSIVEITSAWIDIFPLDGMPNNKLIRFIWKYYILYQRAMYRFSYFDFGVNIYKKGRPWYEKILIFLAGKLNFQKFLDTSTRLERLDKVLNVFPYKKSDYLVNAMGAYKFKEMFHKKYYGNGKKYIFEDTEIWGPDDYDTVCTQLYGNYMIPPRDSEKNHHSLEIIS